MTNDTIPKTETIPEYRARTLAGILEREAAALRANPGHVLDLSWTSMLRGANLEGTELRGANLTRADLRDTQMDQANLSNANLRRTDLDWANVLG